jgi:hypothetical protein
MDSLTRGKPPTSQNRPAARSPSFFHPSSARSLGISNRFQDQFWTFQKHIFYIRSGLKNGPSESVSVPCSLPAPISPPAPSPLFIARSFASLPITKGLSACVFSVFNPRHTLSPCEFMGAERFRGRGAGGGVLTGSGSARGTAPRLLCWKN